MKIGILTIGQSPRVDIVPELKEAIGFEVEIEERGALDNLTWEEVKDLFPGPGDNNFIVTRMKDGKIVKIAKRHVVERMNECIADLERIDVEFNEGFRKLGNKIEQAKSLAGQGFQIFLKRSIKNMKGVEKIARNDFKRTCKNCFMWQNSR